MTKKQIIILVCMVILIIVGGIFGYFSLRKDKKAKTNKNNIELVYKQDLSYYNGYWYESRDKAGLNSIKITSNENDSLDIVITFYDVHTFSNITLKVEDDAANVDIVEDNNSFKGKITFYDNELVLDILESTYDGIELGNTIKYNYKTLDEVTYESSETGEQVDSSYKGVWHTGIKGDFKDTLAITGIEGSKIGIKLNLANHIFPESRVNIVNKKGNFELKDSVSSIQGEIELGDNEIIIRVKTSSMKELNGKIYTFDFKNKSVSFRDYLDKWYLVETPDEKNYLEVKSYTPNTILFDLLINRVADLRNVTANMNYNYGTFVCKSSADTREIEGNVVLDDDRVFIVITKSTVKALETGTVFEYMYRGADQSGE